MSQFASRPQPSTPTPSPARVYLCRALRHLLDERRVTMAELGAATWSPTKRAMGISADLVEHLLDARRSDVHVQLHHLACWTRVLGEQVIAAWLEAEQLELDVVPRAGGAAAPAALEAHAEHLEASTDLVTASMRARDPSSPGGAEVTPAERRALSAKAERTARTARGVAAAGGKR